VRTTVGFVGLGAMGSRLARRLLVTGHAVVGTNRTRGKARALLDAGMEWRDTPRRVAAAAQVVFTMVRDDAALEAIAGGPEGLLAAIGPGKIHVDLSTVGPATSRALAARVRQRGAEMLDAPVTGSLTAAETGALAIMVGGPEAAFEIVEPLLLELGRTVNRVGENGHGLLLKLALDISHAAQLLAFSEGVLLAERGGVDRKRAIDLMSASAIGSPMLRDSAPLVLGPQDGARLDVDEMLKDIRLALDAAETLGVPVPSAAVVEHVLSAAATLGYGERDVAAFREVLGVMSGFAAAA
jgi:3-hydroxyisobutyrate dehydrogenase-like beta-hydroxyacid dehydrogenase